MIWNVISENLVQRGYVQSSRNTRTAEILIKVTEDKKMHICSIIKNVNGTHVNANQIVEAAKQLERKFLLSGYRDVVVMHIIITDGQEEVAYMKEAGIHFWIVDMNMQRLMIYENQPNDYCEMKNVIEMELSREESGQYQKTKIVGFGKRVQQAPFVTCVIIIVNVLIFTLCEMINSTENIDFMLGIGALNYERVYFFKEYYRLMTSMFLHFGFMHIASNMFMLAIVGSRVEKWFGPLRYALIYFVSGLGAGVASLIFHMLLGEETVSAGASGAIYGIFGAMIIMIIKNREEGVGLQQIFFVIVLLVFGSIQAEIDFAAHIGGLVIGTISAIALSVGRQRA